MNRDVIIGVISKLWLYLLLTAAVIEDLRLMKISNRLILTGLVTGMGFSFLKEGSEGIIRVLPNIFFPVILLFFFYLMGAVGSGDIKLFSVIGSYFELRTLFLCIECSFVIAAVLSLIHLLKNKRLRSDLWNAFSYLAGILSGKFIRYESREEETKSRIHFSIAILGGTIIVGVWQSACFILF